MPELSITNIIIGCTVLISMWAFSNREVFEKCKHWPYREKRSGEWFRWLTSGFLHGDYMHLAFNMWALWMFGKIVEVNFMIHMPLGKTLYLIFYVAAIVLANYPTYVRHQDNPGFASIGASGAVSAVVFAGILFYPNIGIGIIFIPGIFIPGFLFGILYLWYSVYQSNHSRDNIDHVAHYAGAAIGFFFPLFFKPSLFFDFLSQVMDKIGSWVS